MDNTKALTVQDVADILKIAKNTVYELDPECLRHKEEQRQLEEKSKQEN